MQTDYLLKCLFTWQSLRKLHLHITQLRCAKRMLPRQKGNISCPTRSESRIFTFISTSAYVSSQSMNRELCIFLHIFPGVPKSWNYKMIQKIIHTHEIYSHDLGYLGCFFGREDSPRIWGWAPWSWNSDGNSTEAPSGATTGPLVGPFDLDQKQGWYSL